MRRARIVCAGTAFPRGGEGCVRKGDEVLTMARLSKLLLCGGSFTHNSELKHVGCIFYYIFSASSQKLEQSERAVKIMCGARANFRATAREHQNLPLECGLSSNLWAGDFGRWLTAGGNHLFALGHARTRWKSLIFLWFVLSSPRIPGKSFTTPAVCNFFS